jgi:hypothetical protein
MHVQPVQPRCTSCTRSRTVPLTFLFFRRLKNCIVACTPMVMVMPARNSSCKRESTSLLGVGTADTGEGVCYELLACTPYKKHTTRMPDNTNGSVAVI